MTELESLGRHLYGGGWQTALSAALGVNLRTVQRWAALSNGLRMIADAYCQLAKTCIHAVAAVDVMTEPSKSEMTEH